MPGTRTGRSPSTGLDLSLIAAFTCNGDGGSPVPVVLNADDMTPEQMRAVAHEYGLESAFLMAAHSNQADFVVRFFVPLHEMEMCGHGAIAALHVLRERGLLRGRDVLLDSLSGPIHGRIDGSRYFVSQPGGHARTVPRGDVQWRKVLDALQIGEQDLAPDLRMQNACTTRTKTLVPLASTQLLREVAPDFGAVPGACRDLESTGIYAYACADDAGRHFVARQFPRSSGYPEDIATGIAAAALANGLEQQGRLPAGGIRVYQGLNLGRRSEIVITPASALNRRVQAGCWIVGQAASLDAASLFTVDPGIQPGD